MPRVPDVCTTAMARHPGVVAHALAAILSISLAPAAVVRTHLALAAALGVLNEAHILEALEVDGVRLVRGQPQGEHLSGDVSESAGPAAQQVVSAASGAALHVGACRVEERVRVPRLRHPHGHRPRAARGPLVQAQGPLCVRDSSLF